MFPLDRDRVDASESAMLMPMKMVNPTMNYRWGSSTQLYDYLGTDIQQEPLAEVWMGAHHRAPSRVMRNGVAHRLNDLIRTNCIDFMGPVFGQKYDSLPFLMKILAVDQPLSIQCHPNETQAIAGFESEEALGISTTARNRSFVDRNGKPEFVYALTAFEALKNVLPASDIRRNFHTVISGLDQQFLGPLKLGDTRGFLSNLLRLRPAQSKALILAALKHPRWSGMVSRLHAAHPFDVGALAPLFMYYRTLKPGQAFFVETGQPHVYLKGLAVEVMGNSDNVIRGALTHKHVDPSAFVSHIRDDGDAFELEQPVVMTSNENHYPCLGSQFTVSCGELTQRGQQLSAVGPQIVLCQEGRMGLSVKNEWEGACAQGESVFIPGGQRSCHATGSGRYIRVAHRFLPAP